MPRALLCGLLVLGWLNRPPTAAAHHFTIDLKVQAGKAMKSASAEAAAPGVKPKPRGVLRVRARTPITARWTLTNADAKTTYKDVTVHFFAVKIDKLGQTILPKLTKGVAAESALTMDFGPKDATKGELTFTIDTPGVYLLRLETIGAAGRGPDAHEHFAALDVVIEAGAEKGSP
jgi:hypothetical protein